MKDKIYKKPDNIFQSRGSRYAPHIEQIGKLFLVKEDINSDNSVILQAGKYRENELAFRIIMTNWNIYPEVGEGYHYIIPSTKLYPNIVVQELDKNEEHI